LTIATGSLFASAGPASGPAPPAEIYATPRNRYNGAGKLYKTDVAADVQILRNFIETRFPIAARHIRLARAERAASSPAITPEGFKLASPPLMLSADWEAAEKKALLAALAERSICVDIGSNVGYYACLARSRGKKVIAIEPLPQNLAFLYRNLEYNGFLDVEVYPVGLSRKPGIERIYGSFDTSSFIPGWASWANRGKVSTLVPVTTLDVLVGERFKGERLVIKMDVEGYEAQVLEGAPQTLALNPKPFWLVEILLSDRSIPGGVNREFQQIFDTFWKHGYEAKTLDLRAVGAEDVRRYVSLAAKGEPMEQTNFVFC
jgi:FkbM family methyltransferase